MASGRFTSEVGAGRMSWVTPIWNVEGMNSSQLHTRMKKKSMTPIPTYL